MDIVIAELSTSWGRILNVTPAQARAAGVPQADIDAALVALRLKAVKTECRRRIYAVASAETQMNMASAAAVIGTKPPVTRTEAENAALAAFATSLDWVQAMRAAVVTLAADIEADIAADAAWPACPEDVLALATSY